MYYIAFRWFDVGLTLGPAQVAQLLIEGHFRPLQFPKSVEILRLYGRFDGSLELIALSLKFLNLQLPQVALGLLQVGSTLF
jgi:hypothetical protein